MSDIVLKDITKRFGKSVAVDNLNLTIADGDFITLLGPSGCGKTTTLRMIAGLETPTEGEIWIDGKCVFSAEKGINVPPSKRDVGFLFQNYALWPHMTVYKNIAFGLENMKWNKKDIKDKVEELCVLLQLTPYLERYPSELSGGQQQRVAIARSLIYRPALLLADEPTGNLDQKNSKEIIDMLKLSNRNLEQTILLITHDEKVALEAERIITIEDGHIISDEWRR